MIAPANVFESRKTIKGLIAHPAFGAFALGCRDVGGWEWVPAPDAGGLNRPAARFIMFGVVGHFR